jgi:hypothetical protein
MSAGQLASTDRAGFIASHFGICPDGSGLRQKGNRAGAARSRRRHSNRRSSALAYAPPRGAASNNGERSQRRTAPGGRMARRHGPGGGPTALSLIEGGLLLARVAGGSATLRTPSVRRNLLSPAPPREETKELGPLRSVDDPIPTCSSRAPVCSRAPRLLSPDSRASSLSLSMRYHPTQR